MGPTVAHRRCTSRESPGSVAARAAIHNSAGHHPRSQRNYLLDRPFKEGSDEPGGRCPDGEHPQCRVPPTARPSPPLGSQFPSASGGKPLDCVPCLACPPEQHRMAARAPNPRSSAAPGLTLCRGAAAENPMSLRCPTQEPLPRFPPNLSDAPTNVGHTTKGARGGLALSDADGPDRTVTLSEYEKKEWDSLQQRKANALSKKARPLLPTAVRDRISTPVAGRRLLPQGPTWTQTAVRASSHSQDILGLGWHSPTRTWGGNLRSNLTCPRSPLHRVRRRRGRHRVR
jgi:hypothetical protein